LPSVGALSYKATYVAYTRQAVHARGQVERDRDLEGCAGGHLGGVDRQREHVRRGRRADVLRARAYTLASSAATAESGNGVVSAAASTRSEVSERVFHWAFVALALAGCGGGGEGSAADAGVGGEAAGGSGSGGEAAGGSGSGGETAGGNWPGPCVEEHDDDGADGTFDSGADGTVDRRATYTYDADGNALTSEWDYGADGTADVLALERTVVVRFGAEVFRQLFEKLPAFGQAICRALAERLRGASRAQPMTEATAVSPPDPEVASLLPLAFIRHHRVLPLSTDGNRLTLGCVDDLTPHAAEATRQHLPWPAPRRPRR
jgi:hypothetical protein